jgi:hypothetical protein
MDVACGLGFFPGFHGVIETTATPFQFLTEWRGVLSLSITRIPCLAVNNLKALSGKLLTNGDLVPFIGVAATQPRLASIGNRAERHLPVARRRIG